jgi:hypothetical protein
VTGFGVSGYDVVELLGYGSGGEVWLAREHVSGDPVALKRLHPGAGLEARDRLRREAAALAGVQHPHIVRLRSVVGADDDLVLVLDLATGGSLARLVAARGTLSPGEVVTVAVPLAQALADVHARGLVHGDVTPANVLFAADGRPLLSDLGVARLLGDGSAEAAGTSGFVDPAVVAGGATGPASDVHGLAATCMAALSGSAPYDDRGVLAVSSVVSAVGSPLLDALRGALAADPAERPDAAALARAVWEAAPAEPVRLGGPPSAAAPPLPVTHRVRREPVPVVAQEAGGRRRRGRTAGRRLAGAARGWRTGLGLLLAATAVTTAAVTGIAWAGADDGPPAGDVASKASTPSPIPTTSSPPAPQAAPVSPRASSTPAAPGGSARWGAVLQRLDAARTAAFAAASPAALRDVYEPGSPALSRDRAALVRLSRAGLRAEGLTLEATSVTVLRRGPSTVRLRVTDVLAGYRLRDARGEVVQERDGRAETRWAVTLRRSEGRWRIYDVARG